MEPLLVFGLAVGGGIVGAFGLALGATYVVEKGIPDCLTYIQNRRRDSGQYSIEIDESGNPKKIYRK